MISPLPAISLVLPLFSGFSKKPSSASKESNFKHYEGATLEWEPIDEKTEGSADYDCYKMMPDGTIQGHKHVMHKHVCVTPDNCLFDGVDEYCLECHYGLPKHM